ncbi:prominin-1-A-like isoform X2, partial [Biomphalaria pfeifferi]
MALPLCQTSKIDDNQMGMKVLYNMVNIFLGDVVHKEEAFTYLNLTEIVINNNYHALEDWRALLKNYIGFSVCIAIGIVFVVIMPLTGLIFCCCRCCGRCGGKSKLHETKNGRCKRRCYCTVLVILNTVALAGVICSFLCNQLTYNSLKNDNNQGTIGTISGALSDVENFINGSINNASDYVIDTFDSTSSDILKNINDLVLKAVDNVLESIKVQELLNQAYNVSADANNTREVLDTVARLLTNLSQEGTELSNNVTDIKNTITKICNKSPSYCSVSDLSNYNTDANFSTLDSMSKEAERVKDSLEMTKYIADAEKEINSTKNAAHSQVEDKTKDASAEIDKFKKSLKDGMNDLLKQKEDIFKNFPHIYTELNDIDKDSKDYTKIVYYAGIGVCCAYLLIVALYYIGILFGLCGERPGEGAPCCNTGTGSNFLMAGVGFTFLFYWILMIICTVMFAVGGIAYTEVCRNFDDHDPSKLKSIDSFAVDYLRREFYTDAPSNFSFVKSIQNCQNNQALYTALQLDQIVNLDKYTNITDLKKKINELKDQPIKLDNITIINDQLLMKLQNFTQALEGINLTAYFTELDKNLTVVPLTNLAKELGVIAGNVQDPSDKDTLNKSAERLIELDHTTIPLMKSNVGELRTALFKLQIQTNLKNSVNKLINQLKAAEDAFNTNKSSLIVMQIADIAESVINTINKTANDVKTELKENLARCAPLSSALYTFTDSFCVLLLNPVNALWFSFGWVLFFFLLCLIFAVLLTDQYRVQHKYEKEFDDPNFMYSGAQADTIPLTSVDQSPRGAHMAMSNDGYRHDYKRGPAGYPPPSYEEQMGYQMFPPPKYNGHQNLSPPHGGPP